MLSIVIPVCNEDRLWWTVRNIWRTANLPVEIVIVDDCSAKFDYLAESQEVVKEQPLGSHLKILRHKEQKGNCPARDWGILEASYDAVLVLDAHCNFFDDGWAARMVGYIVKNPTHVCCTISERLAEDRDQMEQSNGQYMGCYIEAKQRTKTGEYRTYQGKWANNPLIRKTVEDGEPSAVGCIMGGAYLLSRLNYIVKLRRVWGYLRGWGSSEPAISIVNATMGGENMILPERVGHIYRTGKQSSVPWRVPTHYIRYNQYFVAGLVHAGDEAGLEDTKKWIAKNRDSNGFNKAIQTTLEASGASEFMGWFAKNMKHCPRNHIAKWNES